MIAGADRESAFTSRGGEIGAFVIAYLLMMIVVLTLNAVLLSPLYASLGRSGQGQIVFAIGLAISLVNATIVYLIFIALRSVFCRPVALMTSLDILEAAAELVHRVVPPTPQYCWPLLSQRVGAELWVKHENHTPTGAFKLRGGVVYLDDLKRSQPGIAGVISATTGNHGQSIAYAATRLGLRSTIVVPHGNSPEKNRAMQAFGATLVEHGHDFQAAYEHAMALAERKNLHPVRSYHPLLVQGVASYGLELFRAVPDLDVVYVPIGLGSGICGVIAAREALGLKTEIVGVVAANAATYALSFAAGKPVATNSADTFAGGLAVRVPDPERAGHYPPPRGAHRRGHRRRDAPGDAHHLQRHA